MGRDGQHQWQTGEGTLRFGPAISYGIVNVTTNSMFSGARSGSPERAIEDGLSLVDQGFDRVDIGAVAARAGPPVPPEVEAAALLPVVTELSSRVPVAADTFSPEVAAGAIAAGASVINDISGGCREMFELLAGRDTGYVLMHIGGRPREDREPPVYDDPVDHLKGWFAQRIELALDCGMRAEQIVVDPGLDFDIGVADNLRILARLDEFHSLGRPVYLSLSRKDFLGAIAAGSWEDRSPAEQREPETVAATAIGAMAGADIHRLHDLSSLRAVNLANRIQAELG